jgi:hypothetical protein
MMSLSDLAAIASITNISLEENCTLLRCMLEEIDRTIDSVTHHAAITHQDGNFSFYFRRKKRVSKMQVVVFSF